MEESKDGEKGACGTKSKCCVSKALIGLALLGAGWAGGYFCGRNCGTKMCPTPAAVEAPAAPTK